MSTKTYKTMKLKHRTIAMVIFMVLLAGCQKESVEIPTNSNTLISNNHVVYYIVDGDIHYAILKDEESLRLLIQWLFNKAEEGCSVCIQQHNVGSRISSKEKVTYTTRNRKDAENWALLMEGKGYAVSVSYDNTTGIYTCTAIK